MGSYIFLQVQSVPDLPPGDFTSFLLWAVGILVVVISSIFGLYIKAVQQIKATTDLRVKDRDLIIGQKDEEIRQLREEKEKLTNEILPTLHASNSIANTLLQILQNGN